MLALCNPFVASSIFGGQVGRILFKIWPARGYLRRIELEPVAAAPRSVARIQPLRHDAFKPKLTGGNMLVELEPRQGLGQQPAGCEITGLPDPCPFDILQSGHGWRGSNAIRSIEASRIHHAARRYGGNVAARGAEMIGGEYGLESRSRQRLDTFVQGAH